MLVPVEEALSICLGCLSVCVHALMNHTKFNVTTTGI